MAVFREAGKGQALNVIEKNYLIADEKDFIMRITKGMAQAFYPYAPATPYPVLGLQ